MKEIIAVAIGILAIYVCGFALGYFVLGPLFHPVMP